MRRHFAGRPAGEESSESESEAELEQVERSEPEEENGQKDRDQVKKIEIKLKTQELHEEPGRPPIAQNVRNAQIAQSTQSTQNDPSTASVEDKVREETKLRTRSGMVNAEESEIVLAGDEVQELEEPAKEESEESGSEESDDESEESESSDSDYGKPVFVARKKQPASVPKKQDNRHEETLKLVEKQIQQEHEEKSKLYGEDEEVLAVDDTDDLDPATELAQWKVRELKRIKREREELEAREKELEDYERRKAMTDEQILAEDREKLAKQQDATEDKPSGPYLQRYYHKGAFFQDQEILQRDFSERLEDDYKDKKLLPKALQLRDMSALGQKGRSKHRTLAEEDTSVPPSKRPRY